MNYEVREERSTDAPVVAQPPSGSVREQVNTLNIIATDLEELLSILRGQLDPITLPDTALHDTAPAESDARPPGCTLGEKVSDVQSRLLGLIHTVRNLLDRIAL